MAEWAELPAGVTAQLMGHKPSAIAERHYTSRPLDLLRAWHCKLEAWILEQAGIELPKEGASGLRLVKT
jgi:intergrase/recombinase